MPKKSSKSKSKRVTLKQKYKVIKKVKEHGRKMAKEARKSGKKNKAPADPGIPKQWPFKQELINELEEKRRLILEAEAMKKAERKRARASLRCIILCKRKVAYVTCSFLACSSLHAAFADGPPAPLRQQHPQPAPTCCCRVHLQEAARSEADEDMGEAPTLENLQAEADGRQATYAAAQKRARREAAAATPGQVQGECNCTCNFAGQSYIARVCPGAASAGAQPHLAALHALPPYARLVHDRRALQSC